MKKIILMCLFGLIFSQAKLETREYTISLDMSSYESIPIDMLEITGYDIPNAIFNVVSVGNNTWSENINLLYGCDVLEINGLININPNYMYAARTAIYLANQNCLLINQSGSSFSSDLTIQITAEFPIEDTGYIEEGFDFCLVPGNNLVAFPCDNPVSVETAIPELAQAEIEQIIGAGQAATNLNGQFIGSLSNFTPGAGYWFKSSSSMCFNYACAE